MTAKFVVLVAFFALASGRLTRRDAPAPAPADNGLQELQKHAQEFSKTVSESFNAIVNSKSTEGVNKALKEGSETVLQQLTQLSASLQTAIGDANGKAKEALEQSRTNIQKSVEELRKAHPEVEAQAGQLREKLQAAVQSGVQESQKLAKEISTNVEATNQKLAPQIKKAYDDFVKQIEAVQKNLHDAATKQQ